MNYYSAPEAWKLPKWIGALLGGAFTVIAVGSAWAIAVLTHSTPAAAAVIASVPVAAPAVVAPAAPAPVAAAPSVVAPAETAPEIAAAPAPRHHHHAKKHGAKLAKKSHHLSPAKSRAVLAKHESKSSRKSKNDLDRLLGL